MSKAKSNPSGEKRSIRCAIYTRKSTEEGLQQEFNTLDAQRESAESYIASQKNEGWVCLPDKYDDGGFTGGNMDRPAVQRLMKDIEAGKVDCVVVYKVDRLSRSLMDFSRIMETFDKHNVSFVSVTQHFNTTHSMGRLTLNILLSFAQFEREKRGGRTRPAALDDVPEGLLLDGHVALDDVDRGLDVRNAVAGLPPALQRIAAMLTTNTPAEVARTLKLTRSAFRQRQDAIRHHFMDEGLDPNRKDEQPTRPRSR